MKVVNLWAGPGAGKSTTAAGLFHLLKVSDQRSELVTEYAKDLVYERRDMTDQLMILAQQNRRLRRLRGHVEWVITDSPIPLGLVYCGDEWAAPWFRDTVRNVFNLYENVNVHVRRVKPYQRYGRNQDEEEARYLDDRVRKLLVEYTGGRFLTVDGDAEAPQRIFNHIKELAHA